MRGSRARHVPVSWSLALAAILSWGIVLPGIPARADEVVNSNQVVILSNDITKKTTDVLHSTSSGSSSGSSGAGAAAASGGSSGASGSASSAGSSGSSGTNRAAKSPKRPKKSKKAKRGKKNRNSKRSSAAHGHGRG